ncbi:MAG: RNA methyltransferase [Defluviitaleaceae bacterium]|nr:RNA methyltransferase [Defluviitaleaceae bacterium]
MKVAKQIRDIKMGKIKDKFVIEGVRWLEEYPDIEIDLFVANEKSPNLERRAPVVVLGDRQIKALSDTVTPQGVIAVCKKVTYKLDDMEMKTPAFILMIDQISDPGNMGTILRSAVAFGVDFVLASKNCVDVYNSKVIRSTAGAIFKLPVIEDVDLPQAQTFLKKRDVKTIATSPHARDYYYDIDLNQSICLVVGNEARGVSLALVQNCDYNVKIPMVNMESLNVSVACGIIMQEVLRKRL